MDWEILRLAALFFRAPSHFMGNLLSETELVRCSKIHYSGDTLQLSVEYEHRVIQEILSDQQKVFTSTQTGGVFGSIEGTHYRTYTINESGLFSEGRKGIFEQQRITPVEDNALWIAPNTASAHDFLYSIKTLPKRSKGYELYDLYCAYKRLLKS